MSKSDGQILDFDKICRLCLLEKRSMSAIFSKKKSDKKVPLPVRIMSCASLELYEGDGLPASICSKCLLSVNQSYAFREQCEQADTTLRQYAQKINETSEEVSTKITPKEGRRMSLDTRWERQRKEEITSRHLNDSIVDKNLENEESNNCVPSEVFDIVKTISKVQLPKKYSLDGIDLIKKLLKNREISVEKKTTDNLVTDIKEKWLIIRKLSQCGERDWVVNEEMAKEESLGGNESALKCLESMIRKPKRLNDSLVFCKACNLFMKRSSLSGHNRFVHKKIRKYLCQTCGYATHTGSILRQHIQAVHIGYTFECNKCQQKFNLLKRLRKHEEIHHAKDPVVREKKQICHYCGLAFYRLSYLKTHLLTHSEEAPLKCQFCDRRFKFRWAIIQHERLHTGVKPYKCQYCEEVFTQNKVRKSHENKYHTMLNVNN